MAIFDPAQKTEPRVGGGVEEDAADIFARLSERPAELLRFATAGSVDDGKSTLIGRLLYDSKQVLADQLEHVEQTSKRMGSDFLDLSLLTDGLRAEREQGITIDVAYRYFATAERRFIIADTPGHEHLEHVHIASDRNLIDVRFPVQWVIRPRGTRGSPAPSGSPISSGSSVPSGGSAPDVGDYRAYAGQVAGGVLRPGDDVVVLPGGRHTKIAGIDTFDGPVEEAFPPMSVALRLEDDIDVSRGSTIARAQNQPTVSSSFEALLCWMSEQPLSPNRRYLVKHTTRTASVSGVEMRYRIDLEQLHREEDATTLGLNDLGRVRMELSSPLVFDSYRRNKITGSLIVIDEASNETVAAGTILDTETETETELEDVPAAEPRTTQSPNVKWQRSELTRQARWESLGHAGATIWFTGLPGAGKSTIAGAVEERLIAAGRPAFLLDGDNLRHGLNGDLGFDEDARCENVRRTAHVARLFAEAGTVALVSLVSPYGCDREVASGLHEFRARLRTATSGAVNVAGWGRVSVLPRLFEVVGSSVEFDDLHGVTVMGVRRFELTRSSRIVKRSFDLLGASLGLLAVSPLLAMIAVAIKLDSRGPVFFRQLRVGQHGERFEMLKFRTMVPDAEALKDSLRDRNEAQEGLFKIADDPRVTRVGSFLRKSALDELPQLFNILKGEMSLVGPRPLVVEEDQRVEGWHRRRLELTPGMTGHWQILGPARVPLGEMVAIDYLYVANWSLWKDVKILLRTVPHVLGRHGL